MIGRVLVLIAALSTGVRSLPVTSGQLESEDVKVMKCIVEALADVLSRPRPLPVSEDCLLTLRSDDRLVAILRHHSFLRELQDIALGGNQEKLQEDPPLQQSPSTEATPDQSMLESLGGPGERSILGPERRGAEGVEPPQDTSGVKRDHSGHEEAEKRGHKDKKGEKRDSIKKKNTEEFGDDAKSSGAKLWSKRTKPAQMKKKAAAEEEEPPMQTQKRENEEIPHHSKEISNQEADAEKRSPEEEELQLIAQTTEEREDEGSGAKKLDIESLATIESELESVAQKLHELRRTERGQRRA